MAGSKIDLNWVRDEEKGPFYNVTDRRDVALLASRLIDVAQNDNEKSVLVASIIAHKGLMRTSFFVRACVWFFKWRHKCSDVLAWESIFIELPEFKKNLIVGAANHCQYGKDVDTLDAVCGFDQQELDYIASMLHIVDRNDDA